VVSFVIRRFCAINYFLRYLSVILQVWQFLLSYLWVYWEMWIAWVQSAQPLLYSIFVLYWK